MSSAPSCVVTDGMYYRIVWRSHMRVSEVEVGRVTTKCVTVGGWEKMWEGKSVSLSKMMW